MEKNISRLNCLASFMFISLPFSSDQTCRHYGYFYIWYFFAYKIVFFSFQNNPKNLDPSYKMDLDLWDCLGGVKLILQQNCIGLI